MFKKVAFLYHGGLFVRGVRVASFSELDFCIVYTTHAPRSKRRPRHGVCCPWHIEQHVKTRTFYFCEDKEAGGKSEEEKGPIYSGVSGMLESTST